MRKTAIIGCLVVLGLLFLAAPVAAEPYARLTADPPDVCVNPGSEVTYTLTYGGALEWSHLYFDWDKDSLVLVDFDPLCTEGFEDDEGFVCPNAGRDEGEFTRYIRLKIKDTVSPGAFLEVKTRAFFAPVENPTQTGSLENTILTEVCKSVLPSPEFPSTLLPAALVIGVMGILFLVRRT